MKGYIYSDQIPMFGHKDIIGYVVWRDANADFTTGEGYTLQEFYVRADGVVCVYKNRIFIPVNFRAKNWRSFCNPLVERSEDES